MSEPMQHRQERFVAEEHMASWMRRLEMQLRLQVFMLALVVLVGTGPASGVPKPEAGSPPPHPPGEAAQEPATPDEETVAMRALLERSLTDPDLRQSLQVLTECRDEDGMRSMRVWGDGLGVWQGKRQFRLAAHAVTAALELLQKADFAAFAPVYGGPRQIDPRERDRPDDGSAVLISCRIRVALGGQSKESAQRAKGEQSEDLRSLAEAILAIGEAAAESGVETESLVDGLDKVGRGELDPRVLRLLLHRKPTADETANHGPGFLLRLEDREATTRRHDPGIGYGQEIALELEASEVRNLALVLADFDLAAMPANLWAPVYTEVAIEVLDQRKSIQARPFAGLEPGTHGDLQKDFDALVQSLVSLQDEVVVEGTARAD